MKHSEDSILSLQFFCTLIVLAMIAATVGISTLLHWLLNRFFGISIIMNDSAWIAIFTVVIGTGAAFLVSSIIFRPIKVLARAMQAVADGSFETELTVQSPIREIEELYHNFNLMTRELRATEILQSDFVTNVSHEFKTPITAIEGYTTLLQSEDMTEAEKALYVEKILLNTRRLSQLVGNILLISRVENRSISEAAQPFRLDERIREAIISFEPQLEQKAIALDVALEEITFSGNDSLLQHVWMNLLDNAVKFTPQGGSIAVSLRRTAAGVEFCIADSGPGVPPEARTKIFQRFYQAEESRRQEGNGLGLALVQQILTFTGGEIRVADAAQGGAAFTVLLR